MSPQQGGRTVDPAGRYALESRLATGGMGEVWRGRDTVLDRPVAIKLLKPEYADDATFRTRFETEARHAAALHHPHVAAVFDFGESPSTDGSGTPRPYLVMELVDGQPLSALLRPGQPMAPAAATTLLAQAADAIGAAHAAGIVHRDVKPANLLLTRDRRVKITDFGIARAAEGMALTQTGQVMGTPQYFSPEQAQGAPATPASDVYSLGVVAFECLAGRRPFEGPTQVATALAHVREPVPALPDDVPSDLALVVRTCLAKDPHDRFPDGAALAAALRDPATAATAVLAAHHDPGDDRTRVAPAPLAAGAAGAAAAPTPAAGTPVAGRDASRSRRTRAALGALLLAAAAVAVVLIVTQLSGGGDEEPTTAPTSSAPTRPSPSRTPVEDTTVFVDPDDYVGRDVEVVSEELRALGLRVQTDEVANPGGEEPGEVTAVDPAGDLEEGATVTVSHFGAEPEPEPTTEEPAPEQPQTPETTPPAPAEPPSSGPTDGSTQSGSSTGATAATPTASPAARAPSEGDR